MVAAKLAKMPQGARTDLELRANLHEVSAERAGQMLNVSERTVKTARQVHEKGAPELVAAVETGRVSVSAAAVETSAEMWEIAENLHRAGLSKEQRDEHIRRYAELLTAREEQRQARQTVAPVLSDGRRRGPQHEKGIASRIAEDTGISTRTIQRVLAPEPIKPAADPLSDIDATERQYARIVSAWNAAGPEARNRFRDYIDTPVMDHSRFSDDEPGMEAGEHGCACYLVPRIFRRRERI